MFLNHRTIPWAFDDATRKSPPNEIHKQRENGKKTHVDYGNDLDEYADKNKVCPEKAKSL